MPRHETGGSLVSSSYAAGCCHQRSCVQAGPSAISGEIQVVLGPYGPGLACWLIFGMQREPNSGVEMAVLGKTNHQKTP